MEIFLQEIYETLRHSMPWALGLVGIPSLFLGIWLSHQIETIVFSSSHRRVAVVWLKLGTILCAILGISVLTMAIVLIISEFSVTESFLVNRSTRRSMIGAGCLAFGQFIWVWGPGGGLWRSMLRNP